MKTITVVRITPTRSYTLNNRWYNKVKPKGTLFFVPYDREQVSHWVRFFMWKKKKSRLYIHIAKIAVQKFSVRVLATYKKVPLIEVMVPAKAYHKSYRERVKVVSSMTKYSYIRTSKLKEVVNKQFLIKNKITL